MRVYLFLRLKKSTNSQKIYIGQNVRSEGILSSDLTGAKLQVKNLLKKDLIMENYWYRLNCTGQQKEDQK